MGGGSGGWPPKLQISGMAATGRFLLPPPSPQAPLCLTVAPLDFTAWGTREGQVPGGGQGRNKVPALATTAFGPLSTVRLMDLWHCSGQGRHHATRWAWYLSSGQIRQTVQDATTNTLGTSAAARPKELLGAADHSPRVLAPWQQGTDAARQCAPVLVL